MVGSPFIANLLKEVSLHQNNTSQEFEKMLKYTEEIREASQYTCSASNSTITASYSTENVYRGTSDPI